MNANPLQERHSDLMKIYNSNKQESLIENDIATLRQYHQFIRDDEQDSKNINSKWEIRMARKYYNKLYKEYAIVDLSRYRECKIGMRWRIESEVVAGKGQFTCGSNSCENVDIQSYEVPFRYKENGEIKSELVKVRVCVDCARKLFFKKLKSLEHEDSKLKKRKHDMTSKSDITQEDVSSTVKRKNSNSHSSHVLNVDSIPSSLEHENRKDADENSFGDLLL